MLCETATVAGHDGHTLHLKTRRGATCSGCSLKGGCGQYLLARDADVLKLADCELHRPLSSSPVAQASAVMNSVSHESVQIGDQVQISLAEGQLLQLVGLFYGLPLLGLLLFALLGALFNASEGVLVLAAAGGLGSGVLLSRLLLRSDGIRRSVSPQIHRLAAAGATQTLVHGSTK
jgi:sigma-E factor negative regulatory protein RseC